MARDPSSPPPPDRHEQAIAWHRRRVVVTDEEFDRLTARERLRAFRIAGVQEGRLVQQIYDAIDRAVADGTTLDQFRTDAAEALANGTDARAERVFRTEVVRAYSEGRRDILDDPEVRRARPYRRWDTVGDSRDCEICEPLDGTVLSADDPFWRTHVAPLHPGCRCVWVPLSAEEAGEEGVDWEPPESEPPSEGFGVASDYDPDLSGMSPEVARVVRELMEREP